MLKNTPPSLSAALNLPPELITLSGAVHGQSVNREIFYLPDMWMLHFYDYHGRIRAGQFDFKIEPGSASIVPAGQTVQFEYVGKSHHLYTHFRLPGAQAASACFWRPDPRLDALRSLLEGALHFREIDSRRASARLWDVLLGMDTLKRHPRVGSSDERIVEAAIHYIESGIASPLRIATIARQVGVSFNTLTRAFKRRLGISPVTYLRKCRVNRALDLLQHSDLPVKAVACSVGLSDLHHFNKVIRMETGKNPRAWRSSS